MMANLGANRAKEGNDTSISRVPGERELTRHHEMRTQWKQS